jgi:hypothetical protein
MALKESQKSLKKWTKQKWRTPSGKPSGKTGEVYAPSKTISKLKSTAAGKKKLAAANKKKREATAKGKQHAKHGLHKGKKRWRVRPTVAKVAPRERQTRRSLLATGTLYTTKLHRSQVKIRNNAW